MIKKLLNVKSQTIASAAIIVAFFSILSRFIGFIRDRILAGAFGAGDSLDVYFAAFRLPDLLFQLVIVGALSASFIPIFTKYYKSGQSKDSAWKFTSNTLNVIALIFAVVIIVG
ncbi:murein biosynthesis integral membrane protein MurJ, partial [Patescibacteria group bacterium]|nr:murein biosynthesis integral membrane protein MurJ [Patescibacteria group bacterium]